MVPNKPFASPNHACSLQAKEKTRPDNRDGRESEASGPKRCTVTAITIDAMPAFLAFHNDMT